MQVNVNDVISALKSQRNAALDDVATLHARVSLLEGERDSFKQQVEALQKQIEDASKAAEPAA